MSSAYGIFKNTTQPISSSDIPEIATDEKKKIANARKEHLHEIMRKKSWLWELVMGDRMKIRKSRHDIAMCIWEYSDGKARHAMNMRSCEQRLHNCFEKHNLEKQSIPGLIEENAKIQQNIEVARRQLAETSEYYKNLKLYSDNEDLQLKMPREETEKLLKINNELENWVQINAEIESTIRDTRDVVVMLENKKSNLKPTPEILENEAMVKEFKPNLENLRAQVNLYQERYDTLRTHLAELIELNTEMENQCGSNRILFDEILADKNKRDFLKAEMLNGNLKMNL